MKEEDIQGSIFDETDESEVILRNLIDFQLVDKDGNLVAFDDISKISTKALGTVVEPYPGDWRQLSAKYLSTIGNVEELEQIYPEVLSIDNNSPTFQELDRSGLKVGDALDGYCNKTFKWYEAKVSQVDEVNNMIKVHFQGWNAKHDEWIDRQSDRLAAHGSSVYLMREAAMAAATMVPWYESSKLWEVIRSKTGQPFPKLRTEEIEISEVEDWCIDYTYANPTLWIISKTTGIWYRVASAMLPTGGHFGRPLPFYRPVFDRTLERFLCSAHISQCLLDLLPTTPNVSFPVVCEEAAARSSDYVNELLVLIHHKFLIEQISTLEKPADWAIRLTSIAKCHFLNQLSKEGRLFDDQGGLQGILTGSYSAHNGKKLFRQTKQYICMDELPEELFKELSELICEPSARIADESMELDATGAGGRKKGKKADGKDAEGAETDSKPKKSRYPIDDQQYWKNELLEGRSQPPPPVPSHSGQLKIHGYAQNQLLSVWSSVMNFRCALKLPYMSLPVFQDLLVQDHGFHAQVTHPMLRATFIHLMLPLIEENKGMLAALRKMLVVPPLPLPMSVILSATGIAAATSAAASIADLGVDADSQASTGLLLPISVLPFNSNDPGNSILNMGELTAWLQSGDTWLEVLRILISESYALPLPEFFDPIQAVEQAILDLIAQEPAEIAQFMHPIDPDYNGLPDYFERVPEPMDFTTILTRIRSGWYDLGTFDSSSLQAANLEWETNDKCRQVLESAASADQERRYSLRLVGMVFDVFHAELQAWQEGIVLEVKFVRGAIPSNNSENTGALPASPSKSAGKQTKMLKIRYVDWGEQHDEWLEYDSERLAPHRAASSDKAKRRLTPEDLLSRFPELNYDMEKVLKTFPVGTKSQFKGLEGILQDVSLIWSNCKLYFGAFADGDANPVIESAQFLSDKLESMVNERVLRYLQPSLARADTSRGVLTCDSYFHKLQDLKSDLKYNLSASSSSTVTSRETKADEQVREFWRAQLTQLKSLADFSACSVEMKLHLLNWLTSEFLASNTARNYLDAILATQQRYEKEQKQLREKIKEAPPPEPEESAGKGKKGSKLTVKNVGSASGGKKKGSKSSRMSSASAASAVDSGTESGSEAETNNGRRGSFPVSGSKSTGKPPLASASKQAGSQAPAPSSRSDLEEQLMIRHLSIRHVPLGMDRFGNLYWTFQHDSLFPAIYCERMADFKQEPTAAADENSHALARKGSAALHNAPWWVYSDLQDISALVLWLCDRGIQEQQLKKAIVQWTKENGMELMSSDQMPRRGKKKSLPGGKQEATVDAEAAEVINDHEMELESPVKEERAEDIPEAVEGVEGDEEEEEEELDTKQKKRKRQSKGDGKKKGESKQKADEEQEDDDDKPKKRQARRSYETAMSNSVKNREKRLEQEDRARMQDTMRSFKERAVAECREDWMSYWAGRELAPCCLKLTVVFQEAIQLGIGVKEIDQRGVFTTSYKYDGEGRSACKLAGVRIGDHIICAEGRAISYIKDLQQVLSATKEKFAQQSASSAARKNGPSITVLVLRYAHPFYVPGFRGMAAVADEAEISSTIKEQDAEDEKLREAASQETVTAAVEVASPLKGARKQKSSAVAAIPFVHPAIRGLSSNRQRIGGLVLDLLWRTRHRCICSEHWYEKRSHFWLQEILTAFQASMDCPLTNGLIERRRFGESLHRLNDLTVRFMLELEADLFKVGNAFVATWMDASYRHRAQWRYILLKSAPTLRSNAFVCYMLGLMCRSIQWQELQQACTPISKEQWGLLVGETEGYYTLFNEANTVLYYADGHLEHLQRESEISEKHRRGLLHDAMVVSNRKDASVFSLSRLSTARIAATPTVFHAWGDVSREAVPGAVRKCVMSNLRVLMCASPDDANKCSPILLATLAPVASTTTLNDLRLRSARSSKLILARVLRKIFYIIKKSNFCKPFMHPVDRADYPDFYDVVRKPIDLSTILHRIQTCHYGSADDYLADMQLLCDNCHSYNCNEFKKLAAAALGLLEDAKRLVALFQPEIDRCEELRVSNRENEEMDEKPAEKPPSPSATADVQAVDTKAEKTEPKHTKVASPTGPAGAPFTVSMRLDSLSPFLVTVNRYNQSLAHNVHAETAVKLRHDISTGSLVGWKDSVLSDDSDYLPWKAFKMERQHRHSEDKMTRTPAMEVDVNLWDMDPIPGMSKRTQLYAPAPPKPESSSHSNSRK